MKNTVTLFMNPSSRSGRGRKSWAAYEDASWRGIVTESGDDMLRRVAEDDGGTAVAVGGDGTINLVINGALCRTPPPRLGILYAGTSPDFCRFHHLPTEPDAAMRVLREGTPRPFDVCRIEATQEGYSQPVFFASSCNIGFGPAVAARANRYRKFLGDFCGTLLALLKTRIDTKPFSVDFEFEDGERVTLENVLHVAVLKNNFIASGIHVGVPAAADDGYMHVVALRRFSFGDMFRVYRRGMPRNAFVHRAKCVKVGTLPRQQLEYDGDPSPLTTPACITCMQRAMEVIK